jgi:AcrR family transcriptional regulator
MPTATAKRLTREEARARTRDLLLDAARDLFVERGFNGASVEEIAERAGYTRGAFYSNFESKDDIFLAVLDRRNTEQIEQVSAIFHAAGSLDVALDMLRRRSSGRDASMWVILAHEFWLYAMRNPKVRPRLAERERTERSAYKRVIKAQFNAAGFEPPTSVDDLALILQIIDYGVLPHRYIDPDGVRDGFLFDALALLFEAGVALSRERGLERKPRRKR